MTRWFLLASFFGVGVVFSIGLDGVVTVTCRLVPMILPPGACS